MASSSAPPPPLQLFVREPEGLSLLTPFGESSEAPEGLTRLACTSASFSRDGSLLAVVSPEHVRVFHTCDGSEALVAVTPGAQAAAFSPQNTFLQIFQKPVGPTRNFTIRRVEGGEVVFEQAQKKFSRETWPTLQFSEDESVASRCVTNEVQLYSPQQWGGGKGGEEGKGGMSPITERVRVAGVVASQLSYSPPAHLAAFVGEVKGAPASVRIFRRPVTADASPISRRSFYKASGVKLMWNSAATAVLALTHSDVDKTNQSYYGESGLHFLACDGCFEGSVPLRKEGPVHDVQWAPQGNEFVAVAGFMPSFATLFDHKCKPLFDFGAGPRNIARWSPQGNFLCLAGFGNLPGDVEIWDRASLKKVCGFRADLGVSVEWSPCGTFLMVATTAPRLQVSNKVRIYTVEGAIVFEKSFKYLFSAEWRPSAKGVYSLVGAAKKAAISNLKIEKPVVAAEQKPVTAYRPPHATYSDKNGSLLKAQLLGENEKPRALGSNANGPLSGETSSKSSAKNKKRREKAKQEGGKTGGEGGGGEEEKGGREPIVDAIASEMADLRAPSADSQGTDVGKKLRAIKKKLRQVEELREQAAKGKTLTSEQEGKVKQEGSLLQELRELEGQS